MSQKPFYDSLAIFQKTYKTDLAEIINDDTAFVNFYPINKKFFILANAEILEDQPIFNMTTSSGKAKEAQKYARITFTFGGKNYQLFAYQLLQLKNSEKFSDNFFIPFTDKTSGKESYGGGRYIDFKIADIKTGKLEMDFNKAYNPYCAFTTGYNCPIPPAENRLSFAVTAGEKKFGKKDETSSH
jgi:uncharacterized protein